MTKGNNPELWNKLIELVDERLQLGLLDHLRKVSSYHIEGESLFIEPSSSEEEKHLQRALQQITLFAQDVMPITTVKILKAA